MNTTSKHLYFIVVLETHVTLHFEKKNSLAKKSTKTSENENETQKGAWLARKLKPPKR